MFAYLYVCGAVSDYLISVSLHLPLYQKVWVVGVVTTIGSRAYRMFVSTSHASYKTSGFMTVWG